MYQYKGLEDTIAAIATAPGEGAIGIVRISGPEAATVADRVVRLRTAKPLADGPSHTLHYGWVIDAVSRETIDDVLVVLMRAPKSYTAENVVEIHGHGGPTALRAVLQAVLTAGARLALPGEFTKRAFLNGRMDPSQAEAVMDIIQAKTQAFLRQSQHQLKGELSAQLASIREELIQIYTATEAMINFPEDGIDAETLKQISQRIGRQAQSIVGLLASSPNGRLLKEGIRIVLCGKPNVGKSSLLNALLKEQRAIVTDIAGTTRDVLEESMQMQGIPISLVDTAGILEPRDLIEAEAVSRSHLYIKSADVALLVLDHSRPLQEPDFQLMEQLKAASVLVVVNKTDLPRRLDMAVPEKTFGAKRVVSVSALNVSSVRKLEAAITSLICKDRHGEANGLLISNLRHIQALEEAQKNLQTAGRLMDEGTSLEFVSEEIKAAVNRLDAITGRNIDEDLLERIFATFCIGK